MRLAETMIKGGVEVGRCVMLILVSFNHQYEGAIMLMLFGGIMIWERCDRPKDLKLKDFYLQA